MTIQFYYQFCNTGVFKETVVNMGIKSCAKVSNHCSMRTDGQKDRHDVAFGNFANGPKKSSDTVN